jgi:predicted nucleotidyltransferase
MKMLAREEMLKMLSEYKREYSEKYGILEIGIFGSLARNAVTSESDVNICVKTLNPNWSISRRILKTAYGYRSILSGCAIK